MRSEVISAAIARVGLRPCPVSLTFELTWTCNLACGYCDRHTPMAGEMTRAQIFTALEEFHALGMCRLNLDGGEPLTHRHVDDIVDWLAERRVTVSINTNGILVPRKIATVRKAALVKVSLDGPQENHDAMRGPRSFARAIAGATAARDAGVSVEFTCTVGRHNADCIEELVACAEELRIPVTFQPALNSLFLGTERDGSRWRLEAEALRAAFARIERLKRRSPAVGNGWSSLRHFRGFPEEAKPPCAAGWVLATMDPEGVLFPCGQVNRRDRSNSVLRLGARAAFENLSRTGCGQCWCARLVEGNYLWGMRLHRLLPPLSIPSWR